MRAKAAKRLKPLRSMEKSTGKAAREISDACPQNRQ
jgi:hypothetical protein